MADQTGQQKKWAKIAAKAWADEDFKQKLLNDPAAVIKAEGMELRCVEATEKLAWFVLPPKPSEKNITEGDERLAAFFCQCPCFTG